MIDFGGGMIFPSSYGRDQFSAQQEREMEAGQAADEARAELSADTHQEGIEAAAWALRRLPNEYTEYTADELAQAAIGAYLEALNAH